MLHLPLASLAERLMPGHIAQLLGPEVVTPATARDWRPGKILRCGAFDLHLVRGPGRVSVAPSCTTWSLVVPLCGTIAADLATVPGPVMLSPGDLVLLSPGAAVDLVLERAASLATLSAPPRPAAPLSTIADGMAAPSRGLAWLVHRNDLESALAPRDKVKIAEGNLWRPEAGPGRWQPATEILCEALSFGVFRTGALESAHQHQRSWELYHALSGTLKLRVRTHRLGSWEPVELNELEALVLPPGTAHLVEQGCQHQSLAFQSPPAISDREVVSVSSPPPAP